MKIRTKMWGMTACIVMVILFMTAVTGFRVNSALHRQLEQSGKEAVTSAANSIDNYLEMRGRIVRNAADSVRYIWSVYGKPEHKVIADLLSAIRKDNQDLDILYLYMGLESDGSIADGSGWIPPEDYDARERDWYKKASAGNGLIFTDPYQEAGSEEVLMISAAIPVRDSVGNRLGVVVADMSLESLSRFIAGQKIMGGGQAMLLNSGGMIVAGPSKESIMKIDLTSDSSVPEKTRAIARRMIHGDSGCSRSGNGDWFFFAPAGHSLSLAISFPEKIITKATGSLTSILLLIGIVGLIVAASGTLATSKSICHPLDKVTGIAKRMREGDLTIQRREFGITGNDELSRMADTLAEMIATHRKTILVVKQEVFESAKRAESLAALSQQTAASMAEVGGEIRKTTGLSNGSLELLTNCKNVAETIATQSQTASASSAEGAGAADRIMGSAKEVMQEVESTINNVEEATRTSRESIEKIGTLAKSVESISGFVTTIRNIADQTNLLALNAAIEAARAGEAGRGFAVVAEEVRKLAEESAEAAREVDTLIGTLQQHSDHSITATERTGTVLEETTHRMDGMKGQLTSVMNDLSMIDEAIDGFAETSREQSVSSRTMTEAMVQTADSTETVAESIRNIDKATVETAKASEAIAEEAQGMANAADRLKGLLSEFSIGTES